MNKTQPKGFGTMVRGLMAMMLMVVTGFSAVAMAPVANAADTRVAPDTTPLECPWRDDYMPVTQGITYTLKHDSDPMNDYEHYYITATADPGYSLNMAAPGVTDLWQAQPGDADPVKVAVRHLRCGNGPMPHTSPQLPTVTQAVCVDGALTEPTITEAGTSNMNYYWATSPNDSGQNFSGSINPEPGQTIYISADSFSAIVDAPSPSDGWVWNDSLNRYQIAIALDEPDCGTPLVEVQPVEPNVEQSICVDWSTPPSDPTVTLPADTDGIAYTLSGTVAAGQTVTVTATAKAGHVLSEAEGWTLAADGQTATRTIVLDDVDCTTPVIQVYPVDPDVIQASCTAEGEAILPSILPKVTEGITYTLTGPIVAGGKVTVTATAAEGHQLGAVDGWTLSEDNLTATKDVTLNEATDCTTPPTEVVPVTPTVVQGTCDAEGNISDPTLTFVDTEGVTYTRDTDPKAGGKVTVTATAAEGKVLGEAEGWTLSADKKTATIVVEFDAVKCNVEPTPTPTPTPTPSVTPTPTPSTPVEPTPTPTDKPKGDLARTGSDVSTGIIVGAALLAGLGGALVVAANRRKGQGKHSA